MEFNELKKALAAEAKASDICAEWYARILHARTPERLLDMFYAGFDFVTDHDYPSKELRAEFDGIRQKYHIYEDELFSAENPRRLVAYEGAKGEAVYSGYAVAQLWARSGSEVSVKAGGNAYVTIDAAPGSQIDIKAADTASVIIFHHGGKITQEKTDAARIRIIKK